MMNIHAHETDDDHYHEDGDYALDYNPEEDGLWQADHVHLTSVGIDIGSSGTQVVFSRILLQRLGGELSSRYYVVEREEFYQSPVSFTPYAEGLRIDKAALGAIIDAAYAQARLRPCQVDTGAVILTGEALRRENAQDIGDILSRHGGDFVCTMAGHHIEAMLAGYGSGAAFASNARAERVLNIDIGGGTTKFAVLEAGRVVTTAALHVGGRLFVYDADSRLTRLEPAGQALAKAAGYEWTLGDIVPGAARAAVAAYMADAILAAVTEPERATYWLTEALPELENIGAVMFSGGVSEFVYGHERRDFGDMGLALGQALEARISAGALPWKLLPAGAGIRATALGLSEYSVQLSGNTIFVPEPERVLPRRNLRVLRPMVDFPEAPQPARIASAIQRVLDLYEAEEGADIALAFHWQGAPSHARIAAFAAGLALGLPRALAGETPVYIVIDGDIARTLGRILRHELHARAPLLIVDGIELADFDHIDFGSIRRPSNTVPVTIKSLLFSQDPRGSMPPQHPHHAHNH